jgi:hypothetical protein
VELWFRGWGKRCLVARPRDPSRKGGLWALTIRGAAELKSADLTRRLGLGIKQSKGLTASNEIPEIAPQSTVKAIYTKRRRSGGGSRRKIH